MIGVPGNLEENMDEESGDFGIMGQSHPRFGNEEEILDVKE